MGPDRLFVVGHKSFRSSGVYWNLTGFFPGWITIFLPLARFFGIWLNFGCCPKISVSLSKFFKSGWISMGRASQIFYTFFCLWRDFAYFGIIFSRMTFFGFLRDFLETGRIFMDWLWNSIKYIPKIVLIIIKNDPKHKIRFYFDAIIK